MSGGKGDCCTRLILPADGVAGIQERLYSRRIFTIEPHFATFDLGFLALSGHAARDESRHEFGLFFAVDRKKQPENGYFKVSARAMKLLGTLVFGTLKSNQLRTSSSSPMPYI